VESDIEAARFFSINPSSWAALASCKYGLGSLSAGEKDALKTMGPQLAEGEIARAEWAK
jgi:hypothetical protein